MTKAENVKQVGQVLIENMTIDLRRLWPGEEIPDGPVLFVDLDEAGSAEAIDLDLPPFPVIGVGVPEHPVAPKLDAIVQEPVTAELLAEQVSRCPIAAATVVQLLRLLPSLSLSEGQDVESMAYAMLQGGDEHRSWMASHKAQGGTEPAEGAVQLEREGNTLAITLDRPDAGNAIDRSMRDSLYEAFSLASLDVGITRVMLQANGKTFSLGADLNEFGTTTDPATAHAIRSRTLPAKALLGCRDKLHVHIDGACVGAGLEIAAYAEEIEATKRAWFQLPELAMGILPGAGGCVSLVHRIGRQRAALMILSGKRLSARQALDWGLIDSIVDDTA